jgi:hypothetical protein
MEKAHGKAGTSTLVSGRIRKWMERVLRRALLLSMRAPLRIIFMRGRESWPSQVERSMRVSSQMAREMEWEWIASKMEGVMKDTGKIIWDKDLVNIGSRLETTTMVIGKRT